MADDAGLASDCEEREREALIRRIRDRVRPPAVPATADVERR